jgi:purine-nucleoside phosphorylase
LDTGYSEFEPAGEYLKKCGFTETKIAIVTGSGLGGLSEIIEDPSVVEAREIPGYPVSTTPGHPGRIISGKIGKTKILLFQGRVHYYEGYLPPLLSAPVMVAKQLGVDSILLTNAAGGINPRFRVGDYMVIRDFINLAFVPPGRGDSEFSIIERKPVLSETAYSPYVKFAYQSALEVGAKLHSGIYAYVAGPAYEAPAEIRMLKFAGADAVGMSTVLEIVAARKLGMKVLALSLITNRASGKTRHRVSHEQVQKIAQENSLLFANFITEILKKIENYRSLN